MYLKYLNILFFIGMLFSASVTFNVNMSDQDVGDEGPTLWMGHLYPTPGFIMTDEDGDGIWSYTTELDEGVYTYKYRNGHWTDWNTGSGWEEVPQECEVGNYGDREITVGTEDIAVDSVCFGSCTSECIETIYANVTFQVDMSDEELSDSDVVYVQGSFNGWCGYCNPMSDIDGDNVWELTVNIPLGTYEYLFTTNGWDGLQAGPPQGSDCDWDPTDSYTNYGFTLEEDMLLGPYCFGTCWDTCQPPAPVNVTFAVDMNDQVVDPLGVFMIGDFQDVAWDPFLPSQMFDNDGDGVYSLTLSLFSDQYIEYKFQNGLNVESDAGVGSCGNNQNSTCQDPGPACNNRYIQIPSCQLDDSDNCVLDDIELAAAKFNSCNLVSASVNFYIDLNDTEYPNSDYDQCGVNGSWCATESGDWPGWCLTLDDDNDDNIFTGTLENISSGDYEFIVFCSGIADNYSGWGVQLGPTVGSECDFDTSDEFGNYGFSITDEDVDVSYCAGSCDGTCSDSSDDGGSVDLYDVSFNLDGIDDCGFVSVTGTFDNWSGWGANTDNGMIATGLENGDYEYTILCVDTSVSEWWNDIWAASTQIGAPLGSTCDAAPDDEYANYGFTISNSNITVSVCAGLCDETCEEVSCSNNGDVNGDQILNVVDIVAIVSHVLGTNVLDDEFSCRADSNNDDIINVVDIVYFVSQILN